MARRTGIRDEHAFREAARRIVDLVLTDDDVCPDSLPGVSAAAGVAPRMPEEPAETVGDLRRAG